MTEMQIEITEITYPRGEISIPADATGEEMMILNLVKDNMLKKLDDKEKFLFLYCFELGHVQQEAANVLGCHETSVTHYLAKIRQKLLGFKVKT